jgi:hypothetical protein
MAPRFHRKPNELIFSVTPFGGVYGWEFGPILGKVNGVFTAG